MTGKSSERTASVNSASACCKALLLKCSCKTRKVSKASDAGPGSRATCARKKSPNPRLSLRSSQSVSFCQHQLSCFPGLPVRSHALKEVTGLCASNALDLQSSETAVRLVMHPLAKSSTVWYNLQRL